MKFSWKAAALLASLVAGAAATCPNPGDFVKGQASQPFATKQAFYDKDQFPPNCPLTGKQYVLMENITPNNYLSHFNFFNGFTTDDFLHGVHKYVTATTEPYAYGGVTASNTLKIGLDTNNYGFGAGLWKDGSGKMWRKSIRFQSVLKYDEALWVMPVKHMPQGCGTWPSWWLLGPEQWPDGGEIDVIEHVSNMEHTQTSLHVSPSAPLCDYTSLYAGTSEKGWTWNGDGRYDGATATDRRTINSVSRNVGFTGQWQSSRLFCSHCDGTDNHGCSIIDWGNSMKTAGKAFNTQVASGVAPFTSGLGVFAAELDRNNYVRVWFFPGDKIPYDLSVHATFAGGAANDHPDPDGAYWSKEFLYAVFPKYSGCDLTLKYKGVGQVLNIALCGDWAGNAFGLDGSTECTTACQNNGGGAYCTGSDWSATAMAARKAACEKYVLSTQFDPAPAYWEINWIRVYTRTDCAPVQPNASMHYLA